MARGLTLGEAEWVAQRFHETYAALAPLHKCSERAARRTRWKDVTEPVQGLMVDTVQHLFAFADDHTLVMVHAPINTLPKVDVPEERVSIRQEMESKND